MRAPVRTARGRYLWGLPVGARKAKRGSRQTGRARRPELLRLPVGRTGRRRRGRSANAGGANAGGDEAPALAERVDRVRRNLYDLYGDLEYFRSSPAEHRERLRQGLDWPDVGHITSLLRSLAEEDRFAEWLRFNMRVKGPGFARASAREKIA